MHRTFRKPKLRTFHKGLLYISAIVISTNLMAEVYKCEIKGKVSFQSNPCPDGHQTIIETVQPSEDPLDTVSHEQDGIIVGQFIIKFDYDTPTGKWFLFKVGVTNTSDQNADLRLNYQAVDREGFFVKSIYANGIVPANSHSVLTNKIYLTERENSRMYKWAFLRQTIVNQHRGHGQAVDLKSEAPLLVE